MENEYGWQDLDEHFLARLTRAGLAGLRGLGQREVFKCVLNGVHRFELYKAFGGWSQQKGEKEENGPGC